MVPLPKTTHPGGPRYIFARQGLIEKYNVDQADLFKVGTMMHDVMMCEDDNVTVAGLAMVQDMGGMTMGFLRSMSFSLSRKAMTCFQDGYPFRIKGSHIFNAGTVFETLYNMFKPFLKEKLKKRVSQQC